MKMCFRSRYLDHDLHSSRLSDRLLEDPQPMELVTDGAVWVVAIYKEFLRPVFTLCTVKVKVVALKFCHSSHYMILYILYTRLTISPDSAK